MSIGHVKLRELIKAARHDNLAAMALLPDGVDLSTVGRLPFVVAQSPASAHHVLVEDADSYRKPWIVRQVIVDGLGENLFTLDEDRWLSRRKPIAPVFGLDNLDALITLMLETVDETSSMWKAGEVDIQAAMTDLTLAVALKGLLGVDTETDTLASQVREPFAEILDWISYRFNTPTSLPPFVPTARNRRLKKSKSDLRIAMHELVAHRRAQDGESFDILSQMLRAQQQHGQGRGELTDAAIVDECIGFMFAGHETTASTLTWALYELSVRPDLQIALAREGRELDNANGSHVGTLASMPTTEAVMHETLRMYPAGITIARSAKHSTELAGKKLRRGTLVMVPVYSIQRSPELWDSPDTFDPSRGHDGQTAGYLPFGLGPRRCLGARFARTEMQIALSRICSRWELRYEQSQPPRAITAPSLRADGALPLTLASR